MKLRSGISLWQATGPPTFETPQLEDHLNCEVAVMGGGVTGALVAYLLVKEGVDVVLIDKRSPASGSTAASTGLLQYEIDLPLVDLIKAIGESSAVQAYRRGVRAIDEIEQIIDELKLACSFSRRESWYFASHFWHRWRLREEYECRSSHGFEVELVTSPSDSGSWTIGGPAIRSQGDAQLDPYRFTLQLLQRSQEQGLRIFSQSDVLDIHEDANGASLFTLHGSVRAQFVVFATGYESERYLGYQVGKLHSTYALASEPLQSGNDWPNGALIWETARPYFYARQSDDGRAIIGGGDTSFSTDHKRDGLVERKVSRLQRRFEQLFPSTHFEPAFAWAGTFGESKDGLAYIGVTPQRPRAYFALGYGGNGITFAMIAARLITDLFMGRKNEDEALFRFNR